MSNRELIRREVVAEIRNGLCEVPKLLTFTEKHLLYKPFIKRVLQKNLLAQVEVAVCAAEAMARGDEVEQYYEEYRSYDLLLTFTKAYHPRYSDLVALSRRIFYEEIDPIARMLHHEEECSSYSELVRLSFDSGEEAMAAFEQYRETLNEALEFLAENDNMIFFSRMSNDRIIFILSEMNAYTQTLIRSKIADIFATAPAPQMAPVVPGQIG